MVSHIYLSRLGYQGRYRCDVVICCRKQHLFGRFNQRGIFMKNKILAASLGLASLLVTHQALAVPFSSFDPRSFAMGGAGVAAGTSANAVFFNPALLAAATQDDDFSFELLAGGRAAGPDEFIDPVVAFIDNKSMAGLFFLGCLPVTI